MSNHRGSNNNNANTQQSMGNSKHAGTESELSSIKTGQAQTSKTARTTATCNRTLAD